MKGGIILCGLVVLLTLVLWAGFALLWTPEGAAPWRYNSIEFTETEPDEKNKTTKTNRPQQLPESENPESENPESENPESENPESENPESEIKDHAAQNEVPVVATTNPVGVKTGTSLIENKPDDQNTLENQQVKTDDHQFNVTIEYNDPDCLERFGHTVSVPILFRHATAALKSHSISELDAIVQIYHQCKNQHIVISLPSLGQTGIRPSLRQRREDEVKYFLMHMRVDKERIRLPDQL